jgi:magnesium chelatase family protein
LSDEFLTRPPFRAPHHSASNPSIIGGGSIPKPGEITLAHRGVLFLDEFPEFDRDVIEALRQPLEERTVTISRVKGALTFPAQCMLVAAMNPCPCGKGKNGGCKCTTKALEDYVRHISGPILDRIDILLTVEKVDYKKFGEIDLGMYTHAPADPARLVRRARGIQKRRFESISSQKQFNSEMSVEEIDKLIVMTDQARSMLIETAENLTMSGRAFHRIMKVARTIADVENCQIVQESHVLEAMQYRMKTLF